MGMFTSVFKEVRCARCREPFKAEYQIKTGKDWCETFQDGERNKSVPHGKYQGYVHTICGLCSAFASHTEAWILKEGRQVILRVDPKISITEDNRFGSSILWGGKKVAEITARGVVETNKRTKEFIRIEDALTRFWERQARVAYLHKILKISRSWCNGWKGSKIYLISFFEDDTVRKNTAVVVGARIKVVDPFPIKKEVLGPTTNLNEKD